MPNTKGCAIRHKTIDRCLQNRHGYSIAEMMNICNEALELRGLRAVSSMNTIRDDITEIANTYCADIETIRSGRNKRYRYADCSFSIYNSSLSERDVADLEEALSYLGIFSGRPQFEWIEDTLLRIRETLSYRTAERKRGIVGFDDNPGLRGREYAGILFDAIRLGKAMSLQYQSFNDTCPHSFTVHPYYLKEYNNRWFLLAAINGYDRLTNFALDRITGIKDAGVEYRRNTEYDFDEYFKDIVGVSRHNGQEVTEVVLRVSNELLPYIETKPIHHSQRTIENGDEGGLVQISVIPNFELEQVILSYGDGIEVLSPLPLREKIAGRITKAAKKYE